MDPKILALRTKSVKLIHGIKKLQVAVRRFKAANGVVIQGLDMSINPDSVPPRLSGSISLLQKECSDFVNYASKYCNISNVPFNPPGSDTELQGMELYATWLLGQGVQSFVGVVVAEAVAPNGGAQNGVVSASSDGSPTPNLSQQSGGVGDRGFASWVKGRGRACANNLTGFIDCALAITAVVLLVKSAEMITGKDIVAIAKQTGALKELVTAATQSMLPMTG